MTTKWMNWRRWLAVTGLLLGPLTGFAAAAVPAEAGGDDTLKEVRVAQDRFQRQAALPPWVEPGGPLPVTQDKSPTVVLMADTQMMAANDSRAYHVHRAWQVNSTAALQELGRYSIDFNPAYHAVTLHTLRVVRGGQAIDKLATVNVRFLQREAGLEDGVYSGDVSASMLIDDLRVGDVLEVAYTQSGANPVLGPRYLEMVGWDQRAPVEWRRVVLFDRPGRPIAWRFVGDLNRDSITPSESMVGGLRRRAWEQRGMPRVDLEPGVPADFITHRFLQFSEFGRWGEVSDWAVELFRNTDPLPAELQALVAKWQPLPPDQRVSAALAWVQNEIRYFSLSLGESSHRPAAPATVLQRRYGDCKDKSLMLVQLLRAMGVDAQPVLVSARTGRGVSRMLPSPWAFDHAIVRAEVAGRGYFLDPTRQGQGGRLDAMGQVWETAEVLVVKPANDTFTVIKTPDFERISRNELEEKIVLTKLAGDATLTARQTVSGAGAEIRRMLFAQLPPDFLQKLALEPYERRYPGALLAEPARLEDDPVNNVMSIVATVTLPKPARNFDGAWALRYTPSNVWGVLPSPSTTERRQPMVAPLPATWRYRVETEFPTEVAKITDPITRRVRDDNFDYTVTASFRGNRASASYELKVLDDRIAPARMGRYATALRSSSEAVMPVFIVSREDIRSGGVFGLGKPTLQATLENRLKDRIEKLGKSIDGGGLQGDDLAETLCDRADALVDLGKPDDALKDAQLAIKTSPNLGRAWSCRANAYFGQRDFPRAIADYGKAIGFDPSDTHSYYRRGHARYYSGQTAGALGDFARAGLDADKPMDDGTLYAELWRLWAQKKAGQPATAAQLQLAAANPRGAWPRPALAMLHGLVTVDAMLATLDRQTGDERDMNLAEAYFYAGQWYLAQGDKARAADYFRKTREKGVILYIEHVSADLELRQLAAQ